MSVARPIDHPDQVTPLWLTQVLGHAGLLQGGAVLAVGRRSDRSIPIAASRITFLNLQLSQGAGLSIPANLVIKFAASAKEPYFYGTIAASTPHILWPSCYLSSYDPEADASWLLLEDLSQTHFQTPWPIPPDCALCGASIAALARLHANWWDDLHLEEVHSPHLTWEKSWSGRIAQAIEKLPEFLDFLGDRFSADRRGLYERILGGSRWDWLPGAPSDHKTLLHGDAHFWNFMYPKDAIHHPVRLIDWNPWDIGRAADDLAYMLALHWYPERRERFERPLLQAYHHALLECGVEGYPWEALWRDYRLGAIRNLFIPVWQWGRGIHASVWWSHLERAVLAFRDLDCEELLV